MTRLFKSTAVKPKPYDDETMLEHERRLLLKEEILEEIREKISSLTKDINKIICPNRQLKVRKRDFLNMIVKKITEDDECHIERPKLNQLNRIAKAIETVRQNHSDVDAGYFKQRTKDLLDNSIEKCEEFEKTIHLQALKGTLPKEVILLPSARKGNN